MRHIVFYSGGKDSRATVALAHEFGEKIDLIVFSEVMFDKNISGELPEHIDFVRNEAIPLFQSWGYEVKILHSELTYMDMFSHVATKGKRVGSQLGFPMAGKCIINDRCKIKPIRNFINSYNEEITQYVGIALDEPRRLEKLKNTNKVSLLEKYGYTEQMAFALCKKYDLLSPVYDFAPRGGCWFCPNARDCELRHLRNNHRDLWDKLLQLEETPNLIGNKWNTLKQISIHDKEVQFMWEDRQVTMFDLI